MQVSNLVKVDAQVVRVTQLEEGSTYRRVAEKSSYDKTVEIRYGVVTGIVSNGEVTVVTVLEFSDAYGSTPKAVVMTGESDMILIPCPLEEFNDALHAAREVQARALQQAQATVATHEATLELFDKVASGKIAIATAQTELA